MLLLRWQGRHTMARVGRVRPLTGRRPPHTGVVSGSSGGCRWNHTPSSVTRVWLTTTTTTGRRWTTSLSNTRSVRRGYHSTNSYRTHTPFSSSSSLPCSLPSRHARRLSLRVVRARAHGSSTTTTTSSRRSHRTTHTPRSVLQWYTTQLDTAPIRTKCVSAGLIAGTGNVLAQYVTHVYSSANTTTTRSSSATTGSDDTTTDTEPVTSTVDDGAVSSNTNHNNHNQTDFHVNWPAAGRFALLNVCFVAPVLHVWYNWLARALPGVGVSRVLQRVAVDEFVFTPAYVPVLMTLLWGLEGVPVREIPRMVQNEWFTIMLFDWIVYVPVQIVNFRYVPVKFQVLVINLVGVGWNTFVSWRAQDQQQEQQDKGAANNGCGDDDHQP